MSFFEKPIPLPDDKTALKGRGTAIPTAKQHFVFKRPLKANKPEKFKYALFGMGCFWGVERLFWQQKGIWNTAAGYSAGITPNPTYEEVCTGLTGHNEVVHIIYDPSSITYGHLLKLFWENHDPTQGMQQGNDRGTQYRSGIYTYDDDQMALAIQSRDLFQKKLNLSGFNTITTEIKSADNFYYGEEYHQQYLAKNINGYCNIGSIGITCPINLNS